MISTAARMDNLSAHFFARLIGRIAALQAEGQDVIRLDEGNPDLPPAPHILEALTRSAVDPDHHGYQPHRGTGTLRRAWAKAYYDLYQVELNPDTEIVPLLGSKEGVFHLALAYVNPGDVVLAPDPGYITYTRGALIAGGEIYRVPLLPERGFLPDLSAIPADVLRRSRLMWLNYPNNPTAATATLEFLAQAVDFARQHGLLLCHDAAYALVTFDGKPAPSVLQIPGAKDVAVEFNTLSKSHNMAGWRTGAMLGNAQVVSALYTLKTNADSGHFLPVLEATTAALTGDQTWLWQRNQVYRQRRDLLVSALHHIGLPVLTPAASLYVWSLVPPGWDSTAFATAALEEAHVSFTPGTVFGSRGEGYVRFSITAPLERIAQAAQRLEDWMKK
jgi:LL-diaminopimelate aminotransferase